MRNSDDEDDDYNVNILFGYSIAQHIVKSSNKPYVLVGAPKDSMFLNAKFYNMSGAIYKCPITLDTKEDCEKIIVDFETSKSDEVSREFSNTYLDANLNDQFQGRIFKDQWFGVSLSSTGSGSFSACAHKYVHHYNFVKRDEHAAYGACYTFDNEFNQEYKHIPCLVYSHEVNTFYFNNYAYCQAGTSLMMTEGASLLPNMNGQDTFISMGMPGSLNFRGLVNVREMTSTNRIMDYVYKNRTGLCKFSLENDKPVAGGYCSDLWEKNSYLGMSHALIENYMNRPKYNLIAAGAPREDLYGLVRFFTFEYDVSYGKLVRHLSSLYLKGTQQGSYFGFSIVSLDLNGDKTSDLIVGAPYFSRKHEPNCGAIYIYFNHRTKGFSDSYAFNFTGPVRSQFGHAISSAGDIDKDGYGDFVVGAPYEINTDASWDDVPESERPMGAIYLFRGGSSVDKIKLSQKIFAHDIRLKPSYSLFTPLPPTRSSRASNALTLRGLGYSLSGGLDMDANGYPDIAVGALHSNAILVLRSRPVIRINAYLANNDSLQDIDKSRKDCTSKLEPNKKSICFEMLICFEIIGKVNLDIESFPLVNFSLMAESNVTNSFSRAYFDATNNNQVNKTLKLKLQRECDKFTVFIRNDNEDFLRPIDFFLNFQFHDDDYSSYTPISTTGLNQINKYPVVHQDFSHYEFEVNFKKECGTDKKCITDLQLQASFIDLKLDEENVPVLSFKESDTLSISIRLDNNGIISEPAYGTEIYIEFDQRLDFMRQDGQAQNAFTCGMTKKKKFQGLVCKKSDYLAANTNISLEITFSANRLYRFSNISSNPNLEFKLEAKTLSTDINPTNNMVHLRAKLRSRANLFVYGTNTPEQLFYGDDTVVHGESSMKSLDDIGPIIEHIYTIGNFGPFTVDFFQLNLMWPYEAKQRNLDFDMNQGKHLLYLIEKPTKIPNNHPINVICDGYTVDPLKLADRKTSSLKKYRRKRQDSRYDFHYYNNDTTVIKKPLFDNSVKSRTMIIDCETDTAYCHKISCNFSGDFGKDEIISLKITARLWNSTLVEDYDSAEKVIIRSSARLEIADSIFDEKLNDNENSVDTVVYSNMVMVVEKSLPIWIYLVSILSGLIILLICVFGFWMLGFFERKKFGDDKYLMQSEKIKKTPY